MIFLIIAIAAIFTVNLLTSNVAVIVDGHNIFGSIHGIPNVLGFVIATAVIFFVLILLAFIFSGIFLFVSGIITFVVFIIMSCVFPFFIPLLIPVIIIWACCSSANGRKRRC
jgi:hypothetical protein